jgi:hypothetical protein
LIAFINQYTFTLLMKKLVPAIALLCSVLASCNEAARKESPKNELPEALQEQTLSSDLSFKRSDGNLAESMYNELAQKDPTLKKLESAIAMLPAQKRDSVADFNNYQQKNEQYYASLDRPVLALHDSLARVKIKAIIAASKAGYQASIAPHQELLKLIEQKELTLRDLHTIVKISQTLPLIEQYQKSNLPAQKTLKGYSTQVDNAIHTTDSLIKH